MKNNYTITEILEQVYSKEQITESTGLGYFAKRSPSGKLNFPILTSIIKKGSLNCFREGTHFMIYKYPEHKTTVFQITQEGKDFLGNSENRVQLLGEIASLMRGKVAGPGAEYGLELEPTIAQEIEKAIMLERTAFEVAVES